MVDTSALKKQLRELVIVLRKSAAKGPLPKDTVTDAIAMLKSFRFRYNESKFPPLTKTISAVETPPETPTNPAEALLWKLGRWKAYRSFLQFYMSAGAKPPRDGVVFYAFARHLRDPGVPIYDQHALRAVWAICNLTDTESQSCKTVLMNRRQVWKESGTGAQGMTCYTLFKSKMDRLRADGVSNRELDRLLMPLGQALKKYSANYSQFFDLCGFSRDSTVPLSIPPDDGATPEAVTSGL